VMVVDAPADVRAVPIAASLRTVRKAFGGKGSTVVALDGIDLDVRQREVLCIVGASGCGKTTILNLLAGLDVPTAGTVDVHGRATLMFQDGALFPWLSARANVELPMRLAGVRSPQRKERADELLELVQLTRFAERRPHELSGGMRQRVALARALAQDAELVLMDEPFGALDAMTRDVLQDELESVVRHEGTTVVLVTHDVREAARLGDRVVVLTSRPGRIASIIDTNGRERGDVSEEITDTLRREVARHARG
jgi:NitT/TauT family transport system ATP-binding protein